jgi:pectin methylesterase-like acyl-CoA thioesterase
MTTPTPSRRRLAVLLSTAIAVPVAVLATATLPSQAASAPAAGGVYTLVPGASGKCVQVPSASTASGTLLTQAACATGDTSQQWRVVASAGRYNLVNVHSGMCVDIPGASSTSGQQLQQWGCGNAQNNQLWSFTASAAAAGRYEVVGASGSLCLSDQNGSTAGNNPIVQETCADVARMQVAFNLVGSAPPTGGSWTVAADGTGRYTTVQAAIDAVPANNTSRVAITIKPGTYREIVTIPSNKPYITLQGTGSSASQTVIVNNHSSAGGFGTSGSATVFINGHDFIATNLTMSNDNTDGSQDVAASLNADRSVYSNVRFLGNQDTMLAYHNRSYLVNSYVEGTVDFIFGGGTAVFNACSIYEKRSSGAPVTAANTDAAQTYGLLFYRSTITGAGTNVTTLGRPWGANAQVLFRESSLSSTIAAGQPWINFGSTPWTGARYFEYRNTGAGATTNSNRPQLTDAQAASYTPQRYLAGTDGWNPV